MKHMRPKPTLLPGTAPALLTTREVASRLRVSDRTVLTWAKNGLLASIFTPGGHRRYPQTAVDQVLQVMHTPEADR